MKRSLVVGCAAVALAAACGTASAQSKFDVVVGGDALFQGAYINQDRDTGLRSTEFVNRYRLVVTPTAKADNGLEYGGRVRIRAGSGDPTVNSATINGDRAFIFVNSGFGTIQAGVVNGLSDEFGIIGPNVEGVAGGPDNNTVNFLNGSSTFDLLPTTTNDLRALGSGNVGTKVIYLTPIFAGFQGGVSYMPQFNDVNTSVNRVKNSALFSDVVEVGGVYRNEFGSVAVEASAFYEFGQAAQGREDLRSFHVGANVGFGGFKVGGSYANSGDSGYATTEARKEDQQVWIAGAQYTTGPLTLAATYSHSRGNDILTLSTPAKADLYQAGVTYTIAPGLTAGLEYSYLDLDVDLSPAANGGINPDDSAHIIMLDTRIAF